MTRGGNLTVSLYGVDILVENPSEVGRLRWSGKLSPEPETVAWIESMKPGAVFFDIGANVGTHSVRACLRGLTVHAFEPDPGYYSELSRVVTRNGLAIATYRIALLDVETVGMLREGRSQYTFWPDPAGKVQSTSVDLFVQATGIVPDHIKIDVDGNEYDILRGASLTLGHVESVLVEIDPVIPDHQRIVGLMAEHGFTFDPEQVEACREIGGKCHGMANHIFTRQGDGFHGSADRPRALA